MVRVAASEGYASTTIAHVVAEARVSRPTFYAHFRDKEHCFLAAVQDSQRKLAAAVREAVAAALPEQAMSVAARTLVAFADDQPERARVLMNEVLAGGPQALDARDAGVDELAEIVEAGQDEAGSDRRIPDIPAALVIGAVQRMLAVRLRRQDAVQELHGALQSWLEHYRTARAEQRRRTLAPGVAPAPWPLLPESRIRAPAPLPRAHGGARGARSENERERVLYATAEIAREKGYTASTVADIVRRAGVPRRVFSAHFASTQDAFMAVNELAFQRAMAITAAAFASGESWPERMWDGGRAFIAFVVDNPLIAYVAFVESNAVGPQAVGRVEQILAAFTIFLHEGYEWVPPRTTPPSAVVLEAIVTTAFEALYRECHRDQTSRLPRLLAHLVFIALAPFLGATGANRFIDSRSTDGDRRR